MNAIHDDFARQRRTLAHDFHRPIYHFIAPANWMNDPNGVIQWQGQYHLFYQYNPNGGFWGTMHWGHAVSEDLIHWSDLPIALAPTPNSPDETGCFSGCAVNNDGVPTIIYTGTRGERNEQQTQCVATSRDGLMTWEKYPNNPVLSEIPAEAGSTHDFRDPFVWCESDGWYMVLASRIVGIGGVAFLYRSADLLHWEYLHPLLTGRANQTGDVWECPNFFPLEDKWVLIVSGKGRTVPPTVFYFIGEYADHQFIAQAEGVLDYDCLYAPLSMMDDQQRRLLFGWLVERRSVEAHKAAGWAGAHSIPRVLSLREGHLHMEPVPELNRLRGKPHEFAHIQLSDKDQILNVQGSALDIAAEFEAAGTVGLAFACTPDGSEQTRILYDSEAGELRLIRDQSGSSEGANLSPKVAAHRLLSGELLDLRILLDGSVIEIIANGRTSLCSRIYPMRADSRGIRVFGHGILRKLSIWQMASIWDEYNVP